MDRNNPYWERHWRVDYVLPELRGEMILDAGCGAGVYTIRIADEGYTVVAVDKREDQVELTKNIIKKYNQKIPLIKADLFNLPFRKDVFDTSHVGQVIEHYYIHEVQKLLNEIIRVTKTRVVGTTPIGKHHYDSDHKTMWDDLSINLLLDGLKNVKRDKLEKIAETGTEPSCYLFVLEK